MSHRNMYKTFVDLLAANPPIERTATNPEAGKVLAYQITQVEHIQSHINDLLEELRDVAAEWNGDPYYRQEVSLLPEGSGIPVGPVIWGMSPKKDDKDYDPDIPDWLSVVGIHDEEDIFGGLVYKDKDGDLYRKMSKDKYNKV